MSTDRLLDDAPLDHSALIGCIVGVTLAWPSLVWSGDLWHGALLVGTAACIVASWTRIALRAMVLLVGLGILTALIGLQRPLEPSLMLGCLISGGTLWARTANLITRYDGSPVPQGSRTWTALAGLVACVLILSPTEVNVDRTPPLLAVSVITAIAWWLGDVPPRSRRQARLVNLVATPARFVVASFIAIAGLGTLLLALPFAAASGRSIGLIDAGFTAVSATCVTGLAVLDTEHTFSRFGQGVILALIQVGGLGIMTFSAFFAVVAGRRLNMQEEVFASEMLGGGAVRRNLDRALQHVVRLTMVTELLAAAALTVLFLVRGDPLITAVWRGLFTAISAFCNAGFALQSDSLVGYDHDPLILLVVGVTIIAGGLGPVAISALPDFAMGKRVSVQNRVVYLTTFVLLVAPTVAWLFLEWNHSLASLHPLHKFTNAAFQSVTLRTAGFNSVDFASITPATWTICILCMFVGGSPGSTAGGAKTTTLAVLLLAVLAAIRGREQVVAFHRRLPHRVVYQATAVATVGVLFAITALTALQLTQSIPTDLILFEVVSALATVGLSMGATAQLDAVGKVIIIACMFAGRVGPLTLFMVLVDGRGAGSTDTRPALESLNLG